jgi:hypothetical protein
MPNLISQVREHRHIIPNYVVDATWGEAPPVEEVAIITSPEEFGIPDYGNSRNSNVARFI